MVNSEIVEIILRAQDQASDNAKKVNDQVKKIGDSAVQANQKAMSAEQAYQQKLAQTQASLSQTVSKFNDVGNKGAASFKQLSSSQQDSIIKFNMLDQETQTTLQAIRELGVESMDLIPGADAAIAKLASMDDHVKTFGGSFDYAKSKMELMGSSTDSLKGKFQMVGTAIQTYVGNKWDTIKSKVSSFGNFIKTNLSNALQIVRSKVESLGSAFSGLGGLISTAIGGLGMASLKDMTIGLAMNRERMTSLTSATMGSADAGQKFVDVMDNLTNTSLVSLDDLGQAMSTIKMSTGMSNAELEKFTTTVNDVGQRAILMGRSGDEALSLMQAAGRGLNGEFDMLKSNFGITKEQLENLGWSGAADDVEGYQKALDKALESGGSMEGMMDTTTGHLETLKKNFRVAGRHVGEMFTPYIDMAVQKLNSLKETCPGLFENLVMIAGAVSGFATIAPTLSPMLSAFDSIKSTGSSMFSTLKTGVKTVRAFHTALAAGEGIQAAVTAGFTAMGASELLALWPLALIAAAIIAIGAVVFEVGKAFGWWEDLPGMFEAITAGIMRLWNAFINHPDVQAAISMISSALSTLWSWIQQAGQAIMEFFGISTGGEWDIVGSMITYVGNMWEGVKMGIMAVVGVVQAIADAFNGFYNDILVPLGEFLYGLFAPVWTFICDVMSAVLPIVMGLVTAFDQFKQGQMDLPTLIFSVLNALFSMYSTILSMIISYVVTWAASLLSSGINAASGFANGIINKIRSMANSFKNYLLNILTNIISTGTRWVNSGRQKASQMVTGVVNFLRQLPGRALSALLGVLSSIASAGARWVSSIGQQAQNVVNKAYNTLAGLPGKIASALAGVASAIVKPFQDGYNRLCGVVDAIKSKASEVTGLAFGGETAYGGEVAFGGETLSDVVGDNTITSSNGVIDINHNIKLDLENVPSHMDAETLIRMLTSKEVLEGVVLSTEYQAMDKLAKTKDIGRYNRARGI